MTTITPPHPHPLSPDETAALRVARDEFYRVNAGQTAKTLHDITVPAAVFDLVEAAFQHWPKWDPDTGDPIVVSECYMSPDDPRTHVMFKGVKMFRAQP